MVMVSTTHLGIELLDGITLSNSSLVATQLQLTLSTQNPTLFLANLYIFFSVLLPPAYSIMQHFITPNLQDIHHVLLIRKKSADLTNELTHGLHSLGASLGITFHSNHGILSCSYEEQPSPTSGSCGPFPNQQQCFPKVPSWRLSFSRQG